MRTLLKFAMDVVNKIISLKTFLCSLNIFQLKLKGDKWTPHYLKTHHQRINRIFLWQRIIGLKSNVSVGKGVLWDNLIKESQRVLMQVWDINKVKEMIKEHPKRSILLNLQRPQNQAKVPKDRKTPDGIKFLLHQASTREKLISLWDLNPICATLCGPG